MADALIPIQNPAVTDTNLDAESLTVGGNAVKRERMEVAGAAAAEIARVINAAPTTEYGLVTRNIPSGTQTVDSELPAAAAIGDALANPTTPQIAADQMQWNPGLAQWERVVGISELSVLTSASRTTTQTQADQTNRGYRGIAVILDVTTPGTGDITLTIQGKDPVSGKYITLLAGTNVTTTSTNVYSLYPGGPVAANVSANANLWRTWRILVTANNANAVTYSVGAILLP